MLFLTGVDHLMAAPARTGLWKFKKKMIIGFTQRKSWEKLEKLKNSGCKYTVTTNHLCIRLFYCEPTWQSNM